MGDVKNSEVASDERLQPDQQHSQCYQTDDLESGEQQPGSNGQFTYAEEDLSIRKGYSEMMTINTIKEDLIDDLNKVSSVTGKIENSWDQTVSCHGKDVLNSVSDSPVYSLKDSRELIQPHYKSLTLDIKHGSSGAESLGSHSPIISVDQSPSHVSDRLTGSIGQVSQAISPAYNAVPGVMRHTRIDGQVWETGNASPYRTLAVVPSPSGGYQNSPDSQGHVSPANRPLWEKSMALYHSPMVLDSPSSEVSQHSTHSQNFVVDDQGQGSQWESRTNSPYKISMGNESPVENCSPNQNGTIDLKSDTSWGASDLCKSQTGLLMTVNKMNFGGLGSAGPSWEGRTSPCVMPSSASLPTAPADTLVQSNRSDIHWDVRDNLPYILSNKFIEEGNRRLVEVQKERFLLHAKASMYKPTYQDSTAENVSPSANSLLDESSSWEVHNHSKLPIALALSDSQSQLENQDIISTAKLYSAKTTNSREVHEASQIYDEAKEKLSSFVDSVETDFAGELCPFTEILCGSCDFQTTSYSKFRTHKEAAHPRTKIYNCIDCSYSTSVKANLKLHVNSVHLRLKPHACNDCDYRTTQKSSLKTHINTVHLKVKQWKCENCNFESSSKSELVAHFSMEHLRIDTAKLAVSPAQDTSFGGDNRKAFWDRTMALQTLKCDNCDFNADSQRNLKMHINRVHLKLKTHKCRQCDYETGWKGNLMQHVKSVHLKLRTLQCPYSDCGFVTSDKSSYNRHVKIVHLKYRPYACTECEYKAGRRSHFERHMLCHLKGTKRTLNNVI